MAGWGEALQAGSTLGALHVSCTWGAAPMLGAVTRCNIHAATIITSPCMAEGATSMLQGSRQVSHIQWRGRRECNPGRRRQSLLVGDIVVAAKASR
jgi:hypothetical protein